MHGCKFNSQMMTNSLMWYFKYQPLKLLFSEKKNLIYKIKIIHIFNHLNTDCPTSLWNTVIEKIQAWKTVNVKTNAWLGNLCKALKTKQKPRCLLNHSEYFKTKLPRRHISKVVSKILTAVTTNTRLWRVFSVCLNLSFRGRQSTVSMVFHALWQRRFPHRWMKGE